MQALHNHEGGDYINIWQLVDTTLQTQVKVFEGLVNLKGPMRSTKECQVVYISETTAKF